MRWTEKMAERCLKNHDVQAWIEAGKMREDLVRHNPTVRIRMQHGIVITSLFEVGDGVAYGKRCKFGKLVAVGPLLPEDPVSWSNIMRIYLDSHPRRVRWKNRMLLKKLLGSYARLVSVAMKFSKGECEANKFTSKDKGIIRDRTGLSAGDFWRSCRNGTPAPAVSLPLFDKLADAD